MNSEKVSKRENYGFEITLCRVIRFFVIPFYPMFAFYAGCNARVGTKSEHGRGEMKRPTDNKESRLDVVIKYGDYTIVLDFKDHRDFIELGTNDQGKKCTEVIKLVEDKKLRNANRAVLAIRYEAALTDDAYTACKNYGVIVIVMTGTGMIPLESVIEINKEDKKLYDENIGLTPAVFEKFMTDENAQIIKKACFAANPVSNYNHAHAHPIVQKRVNMKKALARSGK